MSKDIKTGLPYFEVGKPILAKSGIHINYFMGEVAPMWKYGTGAGVTVMVGDTGAPTHHGITVYEASNDTSEEGVNDLHGHGANVGGILAGSHNPNFNGTQGHSPSCIYLSTKTLESSGGGTIEYIDKTVQRAIDRKVDILSLSLDAPSIPTRTKKLLKKAKDQGIMIIVAAGNASGTDCGGLASDSSTLAVGSLDRNGRPSSFSDKCPEVQVYWYGRDVVGFGAYDEKTKGQTLLPMTGTSQATPGISGVLSNMKSYAISVGLDLSVDEMFGILTSTCDSLGEGPGLGYGKVNPERAIMTLVAMTEVDEPTADVEDEAEIVDEVDPPAEHVCAADSKKFNIEPWVTLLISASALIYGLYAAFG